MSSVQRGATVGTYVPPSVGTYSRAIAGGHGGAAPVLDPYKNISARPEFEPGRYKRQYEGFARSGAWGYRENTCGTMTLRRLEGATVTIMPALCGCWACGLCGIRRAAWLKAQVNAAVPTYALNSFWTLTLSTKSCTAVESFEVITGYWNNCHRGLTKAHGRFSYLWVVEATAQQYAHLHLLCSLQVSNHELHGRWHTATHGSFGAKVEPVRSDRAANYLAKYCAKQATLRRQPGWEVLAGKRVFSKSSDLHFESFKPVGDGTWEMLSRPYWESAAELRRSARVLSERTKGVPLMRATTLEVLA